MAEMQNFFKKNECSNQKQTKELLVYRKHTRMFAMRSSKDLLWCFLQVRHCVQGPLGPSLLLGL